ncbi:MAG: selenite/tellurite reduction operon b-type cytochrome membrane protein ExtQ [Syntrophales bacterium]|nr:selenite/tellurite reduction operon b-type cytochrome membrane protein ExtQ [Syntrophales bacterium]
MRRLREQFVKSSPHFFRLIKLALVLFCSAVLVLAVFITAPLQVPADMSRVPNPVKSAWFLLWIQELVSYSKYLAYLVAILACLFLVLPWLPPNRAADKARWFPGDQLLVNVMTLIAFSVIIALTIVAMFFRGKNWAFVVPF